MEFLHLKLSITTVHVLRVVWIASLSLDAIFLWLMKWSVFVLKLQATWQCAYSILNDSMHDPMFGHGQLAQSTSSAVHVWEFQGRLLL